ncbi:coiled-coil domain-containing protein 63-like [Diadema antillarum]|uniref:coiled-coil domain-containing protein 63-like n=1 Tax=Diadema antillarum TaxID=105358 RepID=UPI003A89F866
MTTSIGRRRAETPSMNGDAEADYVLAEQELSKLHREYRILKNQRKAYLEESQNIIRKQNVHITSLKRERSEMDMDLRLATSLRVCQKDAIDDTLMRTLLKNFLEYKSLCTSEMDEIRVANKQMRVLDETVRRYRLVNDGRSEQNRYHLTTEKRTRVMENRLFRATVTFNRALRKNGELRERIEELRRERRLYDSLYRKMCADQNDLKVEMNEIIEQSTSAYDSRDEAHNKMAALSDRLEKDQNIFNIEVKGLQRIVDHEEKLKAFMNLKAQDRAEQLKATADEVQKRKQKHGQPDSAETNINDLESSFLRLRTATGEVDLDKLVRRFIYREGLNFALFNYVNEINDDIEMLQEEIKKTENDMASFNSQGMALEGERLKIMKGLERKANAITAEAHQLQGNSKKVLKRLHRLMASVMSTVRKLGCDQTTVLRRLGAREGISELDAMSYLGLIEHTMSDLLLIDRCREHKKAMILKNSEKQGNGRDGSPAKQTGSVTILRRQPSPSVEVTIVPPTIRDEVDVSERSSSADFLNTKDQPLTLEQVRKRVTRRLQRLEAQQQRGKNVGKAPATTPTNQQEAPTDVPDDNQSKTESS